MKYAVVYNGGNDVSKYVGSLSDYKCGEFSADPILMSEDEANKLLNDLDDYVRNEEYIGKTDEDNEQAHWAYDKHEWGFRLEEMHNVDYLYALANFGGDPMRIEDEETSDYLATAIENAQNGIREIVRDSEEWYAALRQLDLEGEGEHVKHIYSGVYGSEFIFCKSEDWEVA